MRLSRQSLHPSHAVASPWFSKVLPASVGFLLGLVVSMLLEHPFPNRLLWALSYILVVVAAMLVVFGWRIVDADQRIREVGERFLEDLDRLAEHLTLSIERLDRGPQSNPPSPAAGTRGRAPRDEAPRVPSRSKRQRRARKPESNWQWQRGRGSARIARAEEGQHPPGSSTSSRSYGAPTSHESHRQPEDLGGGWDSEANPGRDSSSAVAPRSGLGDAREASRARAATMAQDLVDVWTACFDDGRFSAAGVRAEAERTNPALVVLEGDEMGLPVDLVVGVVHRDEPAEVYLLPTFLKPARAVQRWFDNQGTESLQGGLNHLIRPARGMWQRTTFELLERGAVA